MSTEQTPSKGTKCEHGWFNSADGAWQCVICERDTLRAEVQRLKGELREIAEALNDPATHLVETIAEGVRRMKGALAQAEQARDAALAQVAVYQRNERQAKRPTPNPVA